MEFVGFFLVVLELINKITLFTKKKGQINWPFSINTSLFLELSL